MAKGVAMRTALSARGQPINADAATKTDGPFFCDGCRGEVCLVRAHAKFKGDPDRERVVKAFFRLIPDNAASEHGQACPYAVPGQVRALLSSAMAVEMERRPFTERDGRHVLQLAMLKHAEQAVPRTPDTGEYRRRLEMVRASPNLEPYFRSAAGVAKLWLDLDNMGGRREVRSLIVIKMRNATVPWPRFFYGVNELNRLAANSASTSMSYPRAAVVHVRSVKPLAGGRIVVHCTDVLASNGLPRILSGASLFGRSETMRGFQRGSHYVVVGDWRRNPDSAPGTRWDGEPSTTYQNLIVDIFQDAQYTMAYPPEE